MTRFTILTVIVSLFCVATAQAALYTLTDDNWDVVINDAVGQTSWSYNGGVDHLYDQAFWYRVGSGGDETLLHSLPVDVYGPISNDANPDTEQLNLTYTDTEANFTVVIAYTLVGPSPLTSGLVENITITNTGTGPLDLHFFQYVDFDLGGIPGGDTVYFLDPHTVVQSGSGGWLSEGVEPGVIGSPSHREADLIDLADDTLPKFTDGAPTTLDDQPLVGVGNSVGPGNAAWAFQWDLAIGAGVDNAVLIKKHKDLLVPEPATLGLLLIGGLVLLGRRHAELD